MLKRNSGCFPKGKSGNPGGRPKEAHELKELARKHTPEIIDRLLFWMRSKNPRASLLACNILLDRGYGKAPQATVLLDTDDADSTPIFKVIYEGVKESDNQKEAI